MRVHFTYNVTDMSVANRNKIYTPLKIIFQGLLFIVRNLLTDEVPKQERNVE